MASALTRLLFTLPPTELINEKFEVTVTQKTRWHDVEAMRSLGNVEGAQELLDLTDGTYAPYFRAADLTVLRGAFRDYIDSVYGEDGRDTLWMPAQLPGAVGRFMAPCQTLYGHTERDDIAFAFNDVIGGYTSGGVFTGFQRDYGPRPRMANSAPGALLVSGASTWIVDPKGSSPRVVNSFNNTTGLLAEVASNLASFLIKPGADSFDTSVFLQAARTPLPSVALTCATEVCSGTPPFRTCYCTSNLYTPTSIDTTPTKGLTYQASHLDLTFCTRPAKYLDGFVATRLNRTPDTRGLPSAAVTPSVLTRGGTAVGFATQSRWAKCVVREVGQVSPGLGPITVKPSFDFGPVDLSVTGANLVLPGLYRVSPVPTVYGAVRVLASYLIGTKRERLYIPDLVARVPGQVLSAASAGVVGILYDIAPVSVRARASGSSNPATGVQLTAGELCDLGEGWWELRDFTFVTAISSSVNWARLLVKLDVLAALTGQQPDYAAGGYLYDANSQWARPMGFQLGGSSSSIVERDFLVYAGRMSSSDTVGGFTVFSGPQPSYFCMGSGITAAPANYGAGDPRKALTVVPSTGPFDLDSFGLNTSGSSRTLDNYNRYTLCTLPGWCPIGAPDLAATYTVSPADVAGGVNQVQESSPELTRIYSPLWRMRQDPLLSAELTTTLAADTVRSRFTEIDQIAIASLLSGYVTPQKQTSGTFGAVEDIAPTGSFAYLGQDDRIYWTASHLAAADGVLTGRAQLLSLQPIYPDGSPAPLESIRVGSPESATPLRFWGGKDGGALEGHSVSASSPWLVTKGAPSPIGNYAAGLVTTLVGEEHVFKVDVGDVIGAYYSAGNKALPGPLEQMSRIDGKYRMLSTGGWRFPDTVDFVYNVTLAKLQFMTAVPVRTPYMYNRRARRMDRYMLPGTAYISSGTLYSAPFEDVGFYHGFCAMLTRVEGKGCPVLVPSPSPCSYKGAPEWDCEATLYCLTGHTSDKRLSMTWKIASPIVYGGNNQTNGGSAENCLPPGRNLLTECSLTTVAGTLRGIEAATSPPSTTVFSTSTQYITKTIKPATGPTGVVEAGVWAAGTVKGRYECLTPPGLPTYCSVPTMLMTTGAGLSTFNTDAVTFWPQFDTAPSYTFPNLNIVPYFRADASGASGVGSPAARLPNGVQLQIVSPYFTVYPALSATHPNEFKPMTVEGTGAGKPATGVGKPATALGWHMFPQLWAVGLPTYRPLVGFDLHPVQASAVPGTSRALTYRDAPVESPIEQTSQLFYWLQPGESLQICHMGGELMSVQNLNPGVGRVSFEGRFATYLAGDAEGEDAVILVDKANEIQASVRIRVNLGPIRMLRSLQDDQNPSGDTLYCFRPGSAIAPRADDTFFAASSRASRTFDFLQGPAQTLGAMSWGVMPLTHARFGQGINQDLSSNFSDVWGRFEKGVMVNSAVGKADWITWSYDRLLGYLSGDRHTAGARPSYEQLAPDGANAAWGKVLYRQTDAIWVSELKTSVTAKGGVVSADFPITCQLACLRRQQALSTGAVHTTYVCEESAPAGLTSNADGTAWTLDNTGLNPREAYLPGFVGFVLLARIPNTRQYVISKLLWSITNPE